MVVAVLMVMVGYRFVFSFTNIRQLLIYPPGIGGLPINTEDYLCLAQDQFLNDVIIDFYLKYLVLNLPKEQAEKVHVFSTFFYKRLTTKPVKPTRYVSFKVFDLSNKNLYFVCIVINNTN